MSLVTTLEHDIEHLFGHSGAAAHALLKDVSGLLQFAQPAVAAAETDLKPYLATDTTGRVAAIEKYLVKFEVDIAEWAPKIAQMAALPAADLLRDVAQMAIVQTAPAGTLVSLINLAIEWAYSLEGYQQQAPHVAATG